MVIRLTFQSHCIRSTFGGFQNLELRFCHWLAVTIHPRKRVVSFMCPDIGEYASGLVSSRLVSLSREHDGRQTSGTLRAPAPYRWHFSRSDRRRMLSRPRFRRRRQDSGFFMIKMHDGRIVSIILEKRLVCSNHFWVFAQALAHTLTK